MRSRLALPSAACFAGLLLAGCSGGSASIPTGAQPASARETARDAASSQGRAIVTIRVPHRRRHEHYVSPNTQSLSISVTTGRKTKKLGTYDLTPTSSGCAAVDGSTQCTFQVGVPTGKDTFVVDTFSETNGAGSVLSTGTVFRSIAKGKLAVIPLTLSGIVASVTVALGAAAPPAGTALATPVYVTALDPSGATIVGPANYATPITLVDSDASGITALSTSTVTSPASAVTLNYTGGSLAQATITPSVSGATTLTPASFVPTPAVVAAYVLPSALALGGGSPSAIATGADGNLWFSVNGGSPNGIARLSPSGTITPFVGGTGTLSNDNYLGFAAGPDGRTWFTENSGKIGAIDGSGNVTEYGAGSSCPNRIVAGVTGGSDLWFTSTCGGLLGHVGIAAAGAVTVTTYALAGAGANLQGILLGKDGKLYVVDQSNGAIGQITIAGGVETGYAEVPVGAAAGGSNTQMLGIAQTGDGTLWWTNSADLPSTIGSLVIASSFASSAIAQYAPATGDTFPSFLAVAPAGGQTVWVADWENPQITRLDAGPSGAPTLTNFPFEGTTPNVYQEPYDITLGPDGNLWATDRYVGGDILKIAY